jgi:hypothetical protein
VEAWIVDCAGADVGGVEGVEGSGERRGFVCYGGTVVISVRFFCLRVGGRVVEERLHGVLG